ncbi:hypothetical protein N9X12_01005 [Alphaproteobacteria bacterium]|nr:hypothetical protein [Alphaproteobacteria bacterium]
MTDPGSVLDPNTRLATPNFPLMPDESPELFEEVRSRYMSTLRPANAVGERIAEDIISAHWEITRLERWRAEVIKIKISMIESEDGVQLELSEASSMGYLRALSTVEYLEARIEILHRRARRLMSDFKLWQPEATKPIEDVTPHGE